MRSFKKFLWGRMWWIPFFALVWTIVSVVTHHQALISWMSLLKFMTSWIILALAMYCLIVLLPLILWIVPLNWLDKLDRLEKWFNT